MGGDRGPRGSASRAASRRLRAALTLGAMPITTGIVGVLGVVTVVTLRQVASRAAVRQAAMARRTRRCSGETVALERARYASHTAGPRPPLRGRGGSLTGSPGRGYPGARRRMEGMPGSHASIGSSSGGSDGRARVGSAVNPPPLRGDASQRCDEAHADGSPSGGPAATCPACRQTRDTALVVIGRVQGWREEQGCGLSWCQYCRNKQYLRQNQST